MELTEKQKRFLKLYGKLKWNLTETCKEMCVEREDIKQWIKTNELFKQEFNICRKEKEDWAEKVLLDLANKENETAMVFKEILIIDDKMKNIWGWK